MLSLSLLEQWVTGLADNVHIRTGPLLFCEAYHTRRISYNARVSVQITPAFAHVLKLETGELEMFPATLLSSSRSELPRTTGNSSS